MAKVVYLCDLLSVVHYVNFVQVENSRFCRPDILKKLTDAVSSAQVCSNVRSTYKCNIMCSSTRSKQTTQGHLYFSKDERAPLGVI